MYANTLKHLIDSLKAHKYITSNEVYNAMLSVDRAEFTPDFNGAYEDHPLPIGFNATISAPHMHAFALQCM